MSSSIGIIENEHKLLWQNVSPILFSTLRIITTIHTYLYIKFLYINTIIRTVKILVIAFKKSHTILYKIHKNNSVERLSYLP